MNEDDFYLLQCLTDNILEDGEVSYRYQRALSLARGGPKVYFDSDNLETKTPRLKVWNITGIFHY